MSRFRSEVLDWFDAGRIARGREGEVLRAAGMIPAPAEWRGFLGHLTLWLGALALAAAVIFFFAFNWDELGRFAKFGLVEAAILAGLLVCWRADIDSLAGKACLLLLSLLTGALLALTGQVYQTGADSFELFAWWAILILPWVLVSRFAPLWLFWLALVDLCAILWFGDGPEGEPLMWTLFGLNGSALMLWEAAHRLGAAWLRDEWPPRLVAIASGVMATILAISAITDSAGDPRQRLLAASAYLLWVGAFYFWYRRIRPDLFMLAGGVLSLIVAIVALLSKHLLGEGSAGFLLIGLTVIALSAGGAIWLKSVAREQRA